MKATNFIIYLLGRYNIHRKPISHVVNVLFKNELRINTTHRVEQTVKHFTLLCYDLKQYVTERLTSKTTRAGSSLISSDKESSAFDARISFVKSTCSHQRSSALSIDIVLPSSGVSMFILHTDDGTSTDTSHQKWYVTAVSVFYFTATLSEYYPQCSHK